MEAENPSPPDVEIIRGTRKSFEKEVRDRAKQKCSNCGESDRLRVHMIVPAEAGGQFVESNGVLLCRTCDLAKDYIRTFDKDNLWPVNVWVSRSLQERIHETIRVRNNGIKSMSALSRYLISKYVANEDAFDDLEQYQESGNDVKINVWVERDRYERFKAMLKQRGMTVTDGLRALFRMFDSEAKAVARRK